jgi:hypothetical protein
MSYDDALSEAVRAVLDLDLPDEGCHTEVHHRAALLAGLDSDDDSSASNP